MAEIAQRHRRPPYAPGPESGYMLEGETVLMVQGQPDKMVKKGESYQVPSGAVHDAKTGTDGAKVTYVVEKGNLSPDRRNERLGTFETGHGPGCWHRAEIDVSRYADDVIVRDLGRRFRYSPCRSRNVDARPDGNSTPTTIFASDNTVGKVSRATP